jgi:hypothetical protein
MFGVAKCIQYPLDHGLACHIDQGFGVAVGIGVERVFR